MSAVSPVFEIKPQLMPLIAILAVSFAMRDGTHIRMDLLVSRLRGRVLWTFELVK